jgi:hypothetical protein
MLNVLRFIHVFLAVNAIGAGISLCMRMVGGKPFKVSMKRFLEWSLGAGSAGLIFSIHHTSATELLTMLGVYVAAFAVFSWRKCRASDAWVPALVLSTMCVLCLDAVIVIMHIVKLLAVCHLLGSVSPDLPLATLTVCAVLLFAFLSTTTLKRLQQHQSNSMVHKAAR